MLTRFFFRLFCHTEVFVTSCKRPHYCLRVLNLAILKINYRLTCVGRACSAAIYIIAWRPRPIPHAFVWRLSGKGLDQLAKVMFLSTSPRFHGQWIIHMRLRYLNSGCICWFLNIYQIWAKEEAISSVILSGSDVLVIDYKLTCMFTTNYNVYNKILLGTKSLWAFSTAACRGRTPFYRSLKHPIL